MLLDYKVWWMEARIPVASVHMWFPALANMSASPVSFNLPWWVGKVVYSLYKNTNALIESSALQKSFQSFGRHPLAAISVTYAMYCSYGISPKWFRFCVFASVCIHFGILYLVGNMCFRVRLQTKHNSRRGK